MLSWSSLNLVYLRRVGPNMNKDAFQVFVTHFGLYYLVLHTGEYLSALGRGEFCCVQHGRCEMVDVSSCS